MFLSTSEKRYPATKTGLSWYLGKIASADRQEAADEQISLTDPDARSMTASGRGTGMVGYNVQTAVRHHLIVTHEVTNLGHDRPGYRTCRAKPKRPSALTNLKWWPTADENLETCQYGDEPAYADL